MAIKLSVEEIQADMELIESHKRSGDSGHKSDNQKAEDIAVAVELYDKLHTEIERTEDTLQCVVLEKYANV